MPGKKAGWPADSFSSLGLRAALRDGRDSLEFRGMVRKSVAAASFENPFQLILGDHEGGMTLSLRETQIRPAATREARRVARFRGRGILPLGVKRIRE